MGTIFVGIAVILITLNAVRMVASQKKRMKDAVCTGDCANCKTPCQAKSIYHIGETSPTEHSAGGR